jgi:hypothetical protein
VELGKNDVGNQNNRKQTNKKETLVAQKRWSVLKIETNGLRNKF